MVSRLLPILAFVSVLLLVVWLCQTEAGRKTGRRILRFFSSPYQRADLALGWLGVLWGIALWSQIYTGIGGVTEVLGSLFDWFSTRQWTPMHWFETRSAMTMVVSAAYWVAAIGMLLISVGIVIGGVLHFCGYRSHELSQDTQAILASLGELRSDFGHTREDMSQMQSDIRELLHALIPPEMPSTGAINAEIKRELKRIREKEDGIE